MNAGLLGKASSNADTWVPIYTVPTTRAFATADINMTNTTGNAVAVHVAVTNVSAASISTADLIVSGIEVDPNGVFGVTCKPVGQGETIYIKASTAGIGCQVRGFEENVNVQTD